MADGSKLFLQGRIDRVDGAKGEKGYFLRILDYKSGYSNLSLLEIFYGLKLQLLAYLDVVLAQGHHLVQGEVKPGGIFYFSVQDPMIAGEGPLEPAEVEEKILRELKMKGYMLKDAEVVRLMDREIQGHSTLVNVALTKDGEF